jgi:hypothetical protein
MRALLPLALVLAATPAQAREALGVFGSWAAFRDVERPRCYAIAKAAPSTLRREFQPYASIGTWPRENIRNQVHFRLSRRLAANMPITLILGRERFALVGGGADAWAADRRMDAAVVAALRSAGTAIVNATGADGQRFSNSFALDGVATAMDAAQVGCARLR